MKNICVLLTIIAIAKYGFTEEIEKDAKKIDFSNRHYLEFYQDFSEFTELEEIDLSNNILRDLNPKVFKNNHKLHTINLSGNQILEFPVIGSFLESEVKVLNLSNCNLKTIGGNVFDELMQLTVLDLSHNPIDFEASEGFQTMSHYPEKIIVSKIGVAGLKHVCRNKYTSIVVLEENKEVSCKDYTNNVINALNDKKPVIVESDVIMVENKDLDIMISDGTDMEGSGEPDDNVEETNEDKSEKTNESKVEVKVEEEENEETNEEEVENEEKAETSTTIAVPEDNEKIIMEDTRQVEETIEPVIVPNNEQSLEINDDKTEVNKMDSSKIGSEEAEEENEDAAKEDDIEIEDEFNKQEVVPDILNRFSNVDDEKETGDSNADSTDESKDNSEEGESKKKENIMIKPRGALEEKKTHAEIIEEDKLYMIPVEPVGNDSVTSDASKTASSSSNAAVILVIIVALCGTAAVGYKCYKGRKNPNYSSVNRLAKEDPCEGKELKEVKVEAEKKPLMDAPEVVENGKCEASKNEVKCETAEEENSK